MSQLFGRAVRVTIINDTTSTALVVEGLRVQFKIKKSLAKEPNTCELLIFNLSENTRAQIQKKHAKIIVEAGYLETIAQVFSGDARTVDHSHNGADWITKIQCGDGERTYQYGRMAESFRPGTAVKDVARALIGALGIDGTQAIKTIGENTTEQFTQGYSSFGRASNELDRLLKGRGMEWSIQDGRLQVLPTGQPSPDQAVVLGSNSGLIGSPEHGAPEKKGKPSILKVRSFVQPTIKPGGRLKIESAKVNGLFRVQTVNHSGDTHGGEWYSDAECLPL